MGFWRRWGARVARWPSWGSPGVGDEAAAFLRGELLTQLLAGGSCWTVPPWVWLNTAAHADADRVAEVAEAARPRAGAVREWADARAAVAHELLDRAGADPAAFERLQREVLVPLEQDLSRAVDLTPARLVDIAVAELRLIDT